MKAGWLKYLAMSSPGVSCMWERSAGRIRMSESQKIERVAFLLRPCPGAPHVVLDMPTIQPRRAESEREGAPSPCSLPVAKTVPRHSSAYSAAGRTGFSFHVRAEVAQLPRLSRVEGCITALGLPALKSSLRNCKSVRRYRAVHFVATWAVDGLARLCIELGRNEHV